MNSKIIMYHYVQDNSPMRAFSVSSFRDQIRSLKRRFEIVTLTEALEYRGARQTCTLTFDDGLKDSVVTILPVLKEFGVRGTFFISAQTIDTRNILGVQKRHLLLSKIGSGKLVHELNRRLPKELEIRADQAFKADYIDDLLTCSMKWMLDYADHEMMDDILTEIFKLYINDQEPIFDQLYLSKNDMTMLLSEGMELGVHGYSHRQLGALYYRDQETEIKQATESIKSIIGDSPVYMSYPLGSYNPLTWRLLEKYGYAAAVTIKKHDNDANTPRYELGRFDCIDVV